MIAKIFTLLMTRLGILSICAIFAVCVFKQNAWAQSKDEEAVYAVVAKYFNSVNNENYDAIVGLYSDDIMIMFPFSPTRTGKEEIRKEQAKAFKQIKFNLNYTVKEIVIAGDWAYAYTETSGVLTHKETGDLVEETSKSLHILRRQPDNSWKIARYMMNPSQPLR